MCVLAHGECCCDWMILKLFLSLSMCSYWCFAFVFIHDELGVNVIRSGILSSQFAAWVQI